MHLLPEAQSAAAKESTCLQEYQFKVQAPERGNQQKYVTLGKAVLDMARFTGDSPSRPQSLKLKIPLARHPNATLSVLVAASLVKVPT